MNRKYRNRRNPRRGYGLLGLLITLVCVLILFSITMTALNQRITGEGSPRAGTVRSVQDMMHLTGLYQSMLAGARDFQDRRYLTPAGVARSSDRSLNTTANFYSAMVAQNYVSPQNLISANEYSGYVEPMHDYDFTRYDPQRGRYWDENFRANLHRLAHVSFAHMPFFGERYERSWRATMDGRVVLIGNRGPKDGIDDPDSMTYGRDGNWGGHIVFGDGSVQFTDRFTPAGLTYERDGQADPDNIFAMEDGASGRDMILAFTEEMTRDGPVLQYD